MSPTYIRYYEKIKAMSNFLMRFWWSLVMLSRSPHVKARIKMLNSHYQGYAKGSKNKIDYISHVARFPGMRIV